MCGTTDDLRLTEKNSVGCACCAPQSGVQADPVPAEAVTTEFAVEGLSCGSCASRVADALTTLDGVSDVRTDLVPGGTSTVHVMGSRALSDAEVAPVIQDAGYSLTTA
ncbi:heavy-metal-associated domain-containing protein [uncultured Arthrobacter sp.]|uniref:heavy-metal-associated domain-containing protein n=1 Tax=uncultured Arthrobacter sp. TaxID=114050 RepID=UPI002611184C|nr:heavy metal-associated domain-containing protein [uncultured Arthrobacter sp.]